MKCVFLIFPNRKNHGWKLVRYENDTINRLAEYVMHTTVCIASLLENDIYSWFVKLP